MTTTVFDEAGNAKQVTVERDTILRPDTTLEGLQKLKPAFNLKGTVTAGNASPLTDGAAAAVVMSEEKAKALGVKPLGYFVDFAVAGVPPEIMGIGPVPAIRKLLEKNKLKVSRHRRVRDQRGLRGAGGLLHARAGHRPAEGEPERRRHCARPPAGRLRHPQTGTLLRELKRRGGKRGVVIDVHRRRHGRRGAVRAAVDKTKAKTSSVPTPRATVARMRRAGSLFSGVLLFAAGCSAVRPAWRVENPLELTRRTTTEGDVIGGAAAHGGFAWLGIPFARPPKGPLRWKPPQPPSTAMCRSPRRASPTLACSPETSSRSTSRRTTVCSATKTAST